MLAYLESLVGVKKGQKLMQVGKSVKPVWPGTPGGRHDDHVTTVLFTKARDAITHMACIGVSSSVYRTGCSSQSSNGSNGI